MARALYTLVLLILLPLVLLHLLWRGRAQPDYLRHWGERFGRYGPRPKGPVIWIHAVSVGETRAAQTLVAALAERYPNHRLLMTHMTPTGRQTGAELYGERVERVYLAYDYPGCVDRFLDHWQPSFGLIMETELWPNLLAACARRDIPVLLANARLSRRSAGRYRWLATVTRKALGRLSGVAAQTAHDAERLRALGAGDVTVVGNLKFDVTPPEEQTRLGLQFRGAIGQRPVFLCASTREGEEDLILREWQRTRPPADTLLVIVPRHPQRCDAVAALARSLGYHVQRRSEAMPGADSEVWIGDSLGEMFAYFVACDVAFIGGSLLDFGCQNLIEASAVGKPVLIGPSTYNFAQAATDALAEQAAEQVVDAETLVSAACRLLSNDALRTRMGEAGKQFAERHRGATERTMGWIAQHVDHGAGRGRKD